MSVYLLLLAGVFFLGWRRFEIVFWLVVLLWAADIITLQ